MTAIRELYRRVVSALHPDRATSPDQAKAHTALMQDANRARHAGDLAALQRIAQRVGLDVPPPPPPPAPAVTYPKGRRRAGLGPDGWIC